MKSPLDISYQDVINLVEQKLTYMQNNYPAFVEQRKKSDWQASHEIEAFKQLLKLLKRHKKNPQLNLEEMFTKLK